MEPSELHPGRWWHPLEDGRIQCDLCPRLCKLADGQRAFCFIRQNVGGRMVLTSYGRASGFCLDPIEKKPLYHFYPGTSVLSFGTAGCNLGCKFCQNWDISKAREADLLNQLATPEAIAEVAVTAGYITPEARGDFFGAMDAANVDLKAFTERFYEKLCYAHLEPVKETLLWIKAETD